MGLSSPSVAQHHLIRLESMGLIKRESGNFVINKVVLQNCVKISRLLIPRYFFYLLLSISGLLVELYFYPVVLFQAYVIALIIQTVVIIIFAYETIRIWRKGSL